MTLEQAKHRYRTDPLFARVVDTFYSAAVELQLTPGELRDAAMLAAIKFEMNYRREVFRA